VNATAISYTVDQAFSALDALKAIKPKHDAISSFRGGFVFCPDDQVSAAYQAAGKRLFEVANYFYATLTGFKTLNECLDAQGHGYRPTFNEDGGKDRETVFLAEVYDLVAEARGLALRAYRPQQHPKPLPAGLPAISPCVRNHYGRRPAGAAADWIVSLASEGRLVDAIKSAQRIAANDRDYDNNCREWFRNACDALLNAYDADKPEKLTLQWVKDRVASLRDIAHDEARPLKARFLRSSGNEVRLSDGKGGTEHYYEYSGEWDGTLKDLKRHAERCKAKGGDSVFVSGYWLCGEDLRDDFDRTDCEWNLCLTPEEILAIGKRSAS
jgi:hypothetical protein